MEVKLTETATHVHVMMDFWIAQWCHVLRRRNELCNDKTVEDSCERNKMFSIIHAKSTRKNMTK